MAVTPLAEDGFDAPRAGSETQDLDDRLQVHTAFPTDAEATASAAASLLLARIKTFIGFLGKGRKATQKGNLSLNDARLLLPLLQVDEPLRRIDVDPLAQIRSSADVPAIHLVVEVALGTKLARLDKTMLVATKRGRLLGRDPLDDLALVNDAVLRIGPVSLLGTFGRSALTECTPVFDKLATAIVSRLLLTDPNRTVDLGELVELGLAAVDESIERDPYGWRDSFWRVAVTSELRSMLGVLHTLGTVELVEPPAVRLTPGGRWCAVASAREAGIEVLPIDERVIEGSFEDLVLASEDDDPEMFAAIAADWLRGQPDDMTAATNVISSVARTGDPALCRLAATTLTLLDAEVTEAPVRTLLADPATRGWALVWLTEHDLEPMSSLLDPDLEVLVGALGQLVETRDDPDLGTVLANAGDTDTQVALTASLWRVLSPLTLPVLEHLGVSHTDKRVAKAARKATVQHRSLLANS